MLAARAKAPEDIRLPCLATPKLDGIRCLVVNGQALTRSFKLVQNAHIQQIVSQLPEGLDGELVAGDQHNWSFQETTSAVMSRAGTPTFRYWVFDKYSELPYNQRCDDLCNIASPYVLPVLPKAIHTLEELLEYEAACIHDGYEGVMTRTPDGPYKFGRSSMREQWLVKLKRYADSEAIILGFEEQLQNCNPIERNIFGYARRPGGRSTAQPKGTLGSLLVRDVCSGVEFSIGSGMDDELRQEIWDKPGNFLGRIVTYRYQEAGIKDKPRFPRFVRFRVAE